MTDWPPPQDGMPLLSRDDYPETFDSKAYLRDFYSKCDNEPAMKLVLSQLPSAVERVCRHIPSDCGGRLLDVGSGPTIHVACAFRNRIDEIYLSDYLEQNRDELSQWLRGEGRFDWTNIVNYLAIMEGQGDDDGGKQRMESMARARVKAVLPCDVFQPHVIPSSVRGDFDVVTTFFCVEYSTVNAEEYRQAVRNVVGLIKPGGHLVMGGVLNSTWCSFGGIRYTCFTLTESEMFSALREAGIDVDDEESLRYLNHEDMFVIVGKKK